MKRALFIFTGALVFAVLAFLLGSVATNWYADRFARSDDDITTSVRYFLYVWPLVSAVGGYVGDRLFLRRSV